MAKMIPAFIDPATPSAAERRIFELLSHDPATRDWIVLHSLGLARRGSKPYGEIDFVVIILGRGVFCLEAKGGRIACGSGRWTTTNRLGITEELSRSPFMQAREGMFALRNAVLERAPAGFPSGIVFGYAVIMPDIVFNVRAPEWESWQVIDRDVLSKPISSALLRLADEQRLLQHGTPANEPTLATCRTVQQLLRPDFEAVVTRGAQIEETEVQLLRLTDEQFDALDLLSENERCLFEGAAGTGKTMLAVEYARRAASAGKTTLLVCYNRLLGGWLERRRVEMGCRDGLSAGSFFRLLREVIVSSSIADDFLDEERNGQSPSLYERTYPEFGMLALEELNRPVDVLVMDEAQDLVRPGVLAVLNVWLKGGLADGRWAIFGDFRRQAIFSTFTAEQMTTLLRENSPNYARGRLSMNCRNTRNIGEETALLSGFDSPPFRMGRLAGLPVDYHYYKTMEEQQGLLGTALRRMFSAGVKADDIVILSPFRLVRSGIAGTQGGTDFRIVEIDEVPQTRSRIPVVRFATAHAFKGMEASVIVLCDIERIDEPDRQCLLYVAMSRARSHLTVLLNEQTRPEVAGCVRRKLHEGWSRAP